MRTKTNQTGLKMQGSASILGRRNYIQRYVNRRVQTGFGVDGYPNGWRCINGVDPVTASDEAKECNCYYARDITINQVILAPAPKNQGLAGGVGRINVPRFGCNVTCSVDPNDHPHFNPPVPPEPPKPPIPPYTPPAPTFTLVHVTIHTITLQWKQDGRATSTYLLKSWGPLSSAAATGTPTYKSSTAKNVPTTAPSGEPYGSLSVNSDNLATMHIHNLAASTHYTFLLGVTTPTHPAPILSTPPTRSAITPSAHPTTSAKVGFWLESANLTKSIANLAKTLTDNPDMMLGNVYIRINGVDRNQLGTATDWTVGGVFDAAQTPPWNDGGQTFLNLIQQNLFTDQLATQSASAKIWLMPYQTCNIGYRARVPQPPESSSGPTANLGTLTTEYMLDIDALYHYRVGGSLSSNNIRQSLGAKWGGIVMEYEGSSMNTGSDGVSNTLGPAQTYQTQDIGLMARHDLDGQVAVTSFFSILPTGTAFMNLGNQCVQQYYDQQESCKTSNPSGPYPCLKTASELQSLEASKGAGGVAQHLVNGFADKEANDNQYYIRMLSLDNGGTAVGALGLIGVPLSPTPAPRASWAKVRDILTQFNHVVPKSPPYREYDEPWITGKSQGFDSFTFWVPKSIADAGVDDAVAFVS